jgi:hypothetical protein
MYFTVFALADLEMVAATRVTKLPTGELISFQILHC